MAYVTVNELEVVDVQGMGWNPVALMKRKTKKRKRELTRKEIRAMRRKAVAARGTVVTPPIGVPTATIAKVAKVVRASVGPDTVVAKKIATIPPIEASTALLYVASIEKQIKELVRQREAIGYEMMKIPVRDPRRQVLRNQIRAFTQQINILQVKRAAEGRKIAQERAEAARRAVRAKKLEKQRKRAASPVYQEALKIRAMVLDSRLPVSAKRRVANILRKIMATA